MLNQLNIIGYVTCAVEHNNMLYIGGNFSQVLGQARQNFAIINLSDGSLSPYTASFTGGSAFITSMVFETSGRIFISGYFTAVNGTACLGLIIFANSAGMTDMIVPHIQVPVYPVPTSPWASVFSNLTPRWGILKHNPETNQVYASLIGGGVQGTGISPDPYTWPVFGIATFDAAGFLTPYQTAHINTSWDTVLLTSYISYPPIPGYPWGVPSPVLTTGRQVYSFDLDVANQKMYVADQRAVLDNANGQATTVQSYTIVNAVLLTANAWAVSVDVHPKVFVKNNNVFLTVCSNPNFFGPSTVQGVSLNGAFGARIATTPTPVLPGYVNPFGIAMSFTSETTGFGFYRTINDIEEYGNNLIFYGTFTSINNLPGESVISIDKTTYTSRTNLPLNTKNWQWRGYRGPPFNGLYAGDAITYFRDSSDGKLHVFGRFPYIGGVKTSDPSHLILDQDANLPQTRILI